MDGKSLFECGGDYTKVRCFYNIIDEKFSELEKPGRFPPNSMRLTAGDFNGDGVKELALYYTKVNKNHNNVFAVYKVNETGKKFDRLFSDTGAAGESTLGVGQWRTQNNSVGIATGDIDSDGHDEIALLYGKAPGDFKNTKIYLSILKCTDPKGQQWKKAR